MSIAVAGEKKPSYLNREGLDSLQGDNKSVHEDMRSIKSSLFSSMASKTMDKGQRFPSVHRDDRQTRINASAASEILSQESRLTKISRIS